jgi:hypothetical protein
MPDGTTDFVVAWLQDADADSALTPLDAIAIERAVKTGFSYAKVGEFAANHPDVILPALATDPASQTRSPGWADPGMVHATAWRELWGMVDRGVYFTSGTSMHLLEEAGLQTLLASILVGGARHCSVAAYASHARPNSACSSPASNG